MAPSVTNYTEIQNDEIEVLRSIYMDDFVEETPKTGAWNKAADRSFNIGLRTSFGDEEKVAITLSVSFPPTYPKTLPRLLLSFGEEVRPNTRKQALSVIHNVQKNLEPGTEIIYEIATSLQEVLDDTAKSVSKDLPTLDEERTARENTLLKAQEEEQKRQLEATQANEDGGTEEEKRLLQDLAEQEKSRSTQRKLTKLSSAEEQSDFHQRIAGVVTFDQQSTIKDHLGRTLEVTSVCDRVLYRKGPVATNFTVRVWQRDQHLRTAEGENARDAPFLVLKEYFVASPGPDDDIKRAIQNIEANLDLQTWSQVPHPNIIKPINYLVLRSDGRNESVSSVGWTVSVLTELASKGSLFDLLEIIGRISDSNKIRAWALQILEGLHHFHRQGSAHASLHLNNVLLEQGEASNIFARLSDGVYAHALHILKEVSNRNLPLPWRAPEDYKNGRDASPASDVWDFGICLLQMGFGTNVVHEYGSPAALLDDLDLSTSFRALLQQVFLANPKKRPSAWDMLHFEFFRNDDALLEHQQYGLNTAKHSAAEFSSLALRHSRRESTTAPASSRYVKEFVEDGRLGRGGFGEVFRARNRIDGQLYAIKKIKARSRAALDPVLSEASVLSRLNHPNVVRYYASWIDDSMMMENDIETEISMGESSSFLNKYARGPILPPSSRGLDFISSNNAHVVFGNEINDNVVFEDDDGPVGVMRHKAGEEDRNEKTSSSSDTDTTEDDSDLSGSVDVAQEVSHNDANINFQSPVKKRSSGRQLSFGQEPWTMLYIQMEYCRPETLRNLVNTGIQSDPNEGFRLFRQIVQGLAHIHATSIVHRDLKPENIFIDTNGDVRIGDFGLARPGDYRMVNHVGTRKGDALGSFTRDIGTAFYVAPEVLSAGGGKYDEKADMYSLGVVFLEMNVSFATGMERAEGLAALQRAEPSLPPALESPERVTQEAIIRSLTQRQPSLRPSSIDLLNDGKIPVQDEDETLRMARRLVADPKSHLRHELIGSLFSSQLSPDEMHDMGGPERVSSQKLQILEDASAMSRSLPDDLELQTLVRDRLVSIFRRHGAVERTDSPALFPYHPCYPSSEVLRFLSPSGKVLQLPYDLVLPNAMLLARAGNKDERRTFVFDTVYRKDITEDQPRVFGEANFDIVSGDGSKNLGIHEAEAIKCLDEILDMFPHLASAHMCYHINHYYLLNLILGFCDIQQIRWPAVKETISKLNTGDWTWAKVRHELRAPPASIPGTCLDELERFDFRDGLNEAMTKLRSLLQRTAGLETIFDHLQTVVAHLDRFGVKRKIYLNPLSSYNEKFYNTSILFQCLYDQKKRSVFAAGGRYDQLIRDHQPITTRENRVHAVGFQLAWTGLTMGMMTYLKSHAKSKSKRKTREIDRSAWTHRRCEVLVDSFDPNLFASVGVEVLNRLWANDISAELAERDRRKSSDYIRIAENRDVHGWVVLIKSEETIKVKNTARKEEAEVRLSELVSHLRSEIRERDREEGRMAFAKPPLHYQISQTDSSGIATSREAEIKVVISQVKTKKINRKTVVEEARSRAREWRTASQDYPIIAIEIKEFTFDALAKTSLQEPDSWKKLVQDAPANERQYLALIQSTLEDMQETSGVFVYNFRTKQIMHYHLGGVPRGSTGT